MRSDTDPAFDEALARIRELSSRLHAVVDLHDARRTCSAPGVPLLQPALPRARPCSGPRAELPGGATSQARRTAAAPARRRPAEGVPQRVRQRHRLRGHSCAVALRLCSATSAWDGARRTQARTAGMTGSSSSASTEACIAAARRAPTPRGAAPTRPGAPRCFDRPTLGAVPGHPRPVDPPVVAGLLLHRVPRRVVEQRELVAHPQQRQPAEAEHREVPEQQPGRPPAGRRPPARPKRRPSADAPVAGRLVLLEHQPAPSCPGSAPL
jgi:hypothetical protein